MAEKHVFAEFAPNQPRDSYVANAYRRSGSRIEAEILAEELPPIRFESSRVSEYYEVKDENGMVLCKRRRLGDAEF